LVSQFANRAPVGGVVNRAPVGNVANRAPVRNVANRAPAVNARNQRGVAKVTNAYGGKPVQVEEDFFGYVSPGSDSQTIPELVHLQDKIFSNLPTNAKRFQGTSQNAIYFDSQDPSNKNPLIVCLNKDASKTLYAQFEFKVSGYELGEPDEDQDNLMTVVLKPGTGCIRHLRVKNKAGKAKK
jgi:hypothetical protein